MRAVLSMALALILPALPAAAEVDCSQGGETQADMTRCAAEAYREADAVLNDIWAEVRGTLGAESAPFEALLRAQTLWIDYRDAACAAEAAPYEGGSMAPMIETSCQTRLTEVRTEDLRLFLTP
ncbi:lysozyme inhibitor LprI family protein [Pseudoroseicyclus sp. CXY001]|uniref:lysozyme inhibitor LprI family protein n=1 Tax=Pseudoroseicyclus sp. CXY001 TaxID=3242492 RepID=UPI003570D58E